MKITDTEFRKTLGLFPTGVAVVTGTHDGNDFGITISSFTSLSLNPPQILFCLSKTSQTLSNFERVSFFTVNILSAQHSHLADRFARSHSLEGGDFKTHRHPETKCILLSEAIGHVVCEKGSFYEGGDHKIIIGKVIDLSQACEALPLIRQRGQYLTTHRLGD